MTMKMKEKIADEMYEALKNKAFELRDMGFSEDEINEFCYPIIRGIRESIGLNN